ncbi:MAG: hypothetical protein IAF02_27700, partial [Anaerolineae bacterium]|nr:hypothetical protein [Anaerolineae bacterium]
MENNTQPNLKNRFSRKNIIAWIIVFFLAFGIVFALLTLWFSNEQMAQTASVTPQCCDAEATAQAARDALVAAETKINQLEAERYADSAAHATAEARDTFEQEQLATAVSVIATTEAEKEIQASQHQSRELAAYSMGEGEAMPQRSLLLAMEALRQTNDIGLPPEPVAEDAFFKAVSTMGGIGLHGHTRDITAVALSLDNHWLASASEDGTARLWDLTAPQIGTSSLLLPGHYGTVNDLAISPDSRWLVTAGQDGKLIFWDLTAENPSTEPIEYQVYEYGVNKVTFTPDNRWLISGVNDHSIRLWETDKLPSIKEGLVLSGHESSAENIVVSPDSRWLFTSSDDTLNRWDLTAADIPGSLTPLTLTGLPIPPGHHVFPEQVIISPNGRWLAVVIYENSQSNIKLWDLSTPDNANPTITLIENLNGWIPALAFSPDNRYLAAS